MGNSPTNEALGTERSGSGPGQRLVYVMPEHGFGLPAGDEISLREIWDILWRGKWIIIVVTAVFSLASVGYALFATEWYRAEVLLAPAEERSTPALGGQLGGLAALAGVGVGGSGSAESLAVLSSREFLRSFIEEYDLMPVLFAKQWDPSKGAWVLKDGEDAPDIREGVKKFREDILMVQEERETALVTVAVEWKDPELAAQWAAALVRRLNDRTRQRALQEAESNVSYLQAELGATSVVTLQQSIGRLLESEMQKLMLARGSAEFAFRVVDPPEVPQKRVRPKRVLTVVIGTVIGGILAGFAVCFVHFIREVRGPSRLESCADAPK